MGSNLRVGERRVRMAPAAPEENVLAPEVQGPPPPPAATPVSSPSPASTGPEDSFTPRASGRASRRNPLRVPPPPARPLEQELRADPRFSRLGEPTQAAVLERARAVGNEPIARQNLRDLATSDGFARLPEAQQRSLLDLQGRTPLDRQHTERLQGLADSPQFQGLDEAVRGNVLAQLSQHPTDGGAQDTLSRLATAPGFARLPVDDQQRLLHFVGGTNPSQSTPARRELGRLLADPGFQGADAAGQQARLGTFLTQQPSTPGLVAGLEQDRQTRPWQPGIFHGPTAVRNHRFNSGRADADRYEVELEGRRVPIFMPRNPDPAQGHLPTIGQVVHGLSVMPPSSRASVTEVNVEPGRNPQDARWAGRSNDPNFRSYMTAGADGVIRIYPTAQPQSQAVMNDSLIHETGHILALGRWGNDSERDRGWAPWRSAIQRDGIRPSRYGASTPAEDFSEALVLYHRSRGTPQEREFRAMMPERFRLIERLLSEPRTR
ncbi:hypothetical protein LZ198_03670 [Myxococcus sp. K15C18031901]|uniref:hypothetical protein n=1 Tax=Myxococcus dinghuensis TaxID=2906761 RepID=UPI0020A7260A|nr:hypothetical protein [Myxococcus dinghuensis]MCP3097971.1 hypothetical protein [Myxococcus dinghuensis]